MKSEKIVRRKLADGSVRVYRYDRTERPREPTLADLIFRYRKSAEWHALKPSSRKTYEAAFLLMEPLAPLPLRALKRRHIKDGMNALVTAGKIGNARLLVAIFGVILQHAVEDELIDFNPARGIKTPKSTPYKAWTDEQITHALRVLPEHLRRALILGLYTGQRVGDCARMTWADWDGSTIRVRQQKTGVEVWIPAHNALKAEMEAWRAEAKTLTILANRAGKPWANASSLSHTFNDELRGPLEGLVFHGLRKTAAVRLAEAGCTVHEIAAITGHQSLAMVQHYTAAADRRRQAKAAVIKLESFANGKQRKTDT